MQIVSFIEKVVFAFLVGTALAAPQHFLTHGAVLAAPAVAVHHPPTVAVAHAPATIVAAGPTITGYSYTSEVRHHAPARVIAAPLVHAPVVHAAPVVAHAAPVVAHHAPVVAHAAPLLTHGPAIAKTYTTVTGHLAAAPLVAAHHAPVVAAHHAPVVAAHHAPLLAAPTLLAPGWKKA